MPPRSIAMVVAVAAGALGLAGCMVAGNGEDVDGSIPPPSRLDTQDGRAVERFAAARGRAALLPRLAVRGSPLTNVDEYRTNQAYFLSFSYGSCATESHSGCALPLSVQLFPLVGRNPTNWGPRSRCFRGRAAGVPAGVLPGNSALELYTERTTVVISGQPPQVLRAAGALRTIGGEPARTPLRPPPRWVAEELQRCVAAPLVAALAE